MYIAVDREDLLIGVKRRQSPTTVVTFSGAGIQSGTVQIHEFRGLPKMRGPAEQTGEAVNIISVIDRHRRWYNHGLTSEISRIVNRIADRLGSTNVVTLGNSMGGYGAVIFAKRLTKCRQAIAFVPHSAVHPDIAAFDTRSPQWRRHIATWDTRDAVDEIDPGVRYDLFFGSDEIDAEHARRFGKLQTPNLAIHIRPGIGHNLANHMRDEGTLYPTIADVIWRDAPLKREIAIDRSVGA